MNIKSLRIILRRFHLFHLHEIHVCHSKGKGKAIPLQAWTGPEGFQEFEIPRCQGNLHMKVVSLSALCTGRFYPQEIFLVPIDIYMPYR
jgi:hypothetical protein